MPRKPNSGEPAWIDPDDAPELGEAFFTRADVFEGDRLVSRGGPKLDKPKRQITLRLEHRAEKWEPVFRKDDANSKI